MEDMIQYVCTECRFRFKRKVSWNDTMCPNCGRERSFERADLTINKMIKDVDDLAD
jgi:DNA-directed RNA polymerase subunit RPC12/RpoP